MPSTVPRRFTGFDRNALELLRELEANNDATWFNARRTRFRDLLIEPAIDLVIEIGPLLRARISPGLRAEPRVGGSILRMRKDARYAREQPFRTELELWFWEGRGPSYRHPGFFVRIGADHLAMGAGISLLQPDLLLRYRHQVDLPASGRELAELLRKLEASGARVGGQHLHRVPRPFPTDHERAALLKQLGLIAVRVEPLPGAAAEAVVGPILPELLISGFRRLAPLWRWLRALE
jgi:uncharacterized protein (TIGR02453 family)